MAEKKYPWDFDEETKRALDERAEKLKLDWGDMRTVRVWIKSRAGMILATAIQYFMIARGMMDSLPPLPEGVEELEEPPYPAGFPLSVERCAFCSRDETEVQVAPAKTFKFNIFGICVDCARLAMKAVEALPPKEGPEAPKTPA